MPNGFTNPTVESFCAISGQMKHDSNAVHVFIEKVLNVLEDSWSTLQKRIYFSNGTDSQYKNYKNFANLCHHMSGFQLFQLAADSYFFAASHGRSLSDNIGGTVRSLVANTSLRSLKEPIELSQKRFCGVFLGT